MKKLVLILGMTTGLNQTIQANFLDGLKKALQEAAQEAKEQEAAANTEKEKMKVFQENFLKPVELTIKKAIDEATSLELQNKLLKTLETFHTEITKKFDSALNQGLKKSNKFKNL